MCKCKDIATIYQTKKSSMDTFIRLGSSSMGFRGYVPLSRGGSLQMNGFENRLSHEDGANGLPPDCISRSCL